MLVARVVERESTNPAMRPAAKERDDAGLGLVIEKDRYDPAVALLVINVVIEEATFPIDSFALFRRHVTFDTPPVFRCADTEDKVRMVAANLVIAPAGPIDDLLVVKLVEFDVDTVGT